jgi:hypothetical protein
MMTLLLICKEFPINKALLTLPINLNFFIMYEKLVSFMQENLEHAESFWKVLRLDTCLK